MFFIPFAILLAAAPSQDYKAEIEKWRGQREARLKAEGGWLTVAGLFWLKEGQNSIGTSEQHRIQLPSRLGQAVTGAVELRDGRVIIQLPAGSPLRVNGKRVRSAELRSDVETKGQPDTVSLGDVSFFVIRRGERLGIRLKDNQSEYRRNFQGLDWFPVASEWRKQAKWVPYPQPKKIVVDSLSGDKQEGIAPGYAVFRVGAKEYRLEPTSEGDQLFFVFRDKTAGKLTYGAARFLYAEPPENGVVVLDFNKAYNPPCAFTPYATCPLPTPQNRLPIEVPAGEKKYKGGDH